jgi:hypothetical protein
MLCSILISVGWFCARIIASSHPIESFLTNVVDKRRQQYQQQGNISLPCKATNQSATYTINNILLSVVQWCTTHTLVWFSTWKGQMHTTVLPQLAYNVYLISKYIHTSALLKLPSLACWVHLTPLHVPFSPST